MKIITRSGNEETIRLDAVTERIRELVQGTNINQKSLSNAIDPVTIATKVCSQIRNLISTSELDELTSSICMNLSLSSAFR